VPIPTQSNDVLMQTALDQKTMAKFKALKGKRVTVTETLFPAHMGHHFTGGPGAADLNHRGQATSASDYLMTEFGRGSR